jgi:hypothetical protein
MTSELSTRLDNHYASLVALNSCMDALPPLEQIEYIEQKTIENFQLKEEVEFVFKKEIPKLISTIINNSADILKKLAERRTELLSQKTDQQDVQNTTYLINELAALWDGTPVDFSHVTANAGLPGSVILSNKNSQILSSTSNAGYNSRATIELTQGQSNAKLEQLKELEDWQMLFNEVKKGLKQDTEADFLKILSLYKQARDYYALKNTCIPDQINGFMLSIEAYLTAIIEAQQNKEKFPAAASHGMSSEQMKELYAVHYKQYHK